MHLGRRWLWTCLFALVWLAGGAWIGSTKVLEAATTQAGVAATDNKVEKKPKTAQSWAPCETGDILGAGDRIRTGPGSAATLLLADKSVMRMSQNTEILLVTLDSGENDSLIRRFQLSAGRVWSDVTPGAPTGSVFEVHGPNAVASVKGTAFEVGAEDADTEITVWEGQVEALNPQIDTVPELIGPAHPYNSFRAAHRARGRKFKRDIASMSQWQQWNMERRRAWLEAHPRLPQRIRFERQMLRDFQRRFHKAPPHLQRRLKPLPSPPRPRPLRTPR